MGQYISKDALAAEIKRLIKHSEMVADHNTQITELVSRELDALYHLISFLDTLEEPANEDLEEAANSCSSCIYLEEVLSDDDKEVLKERLVNTFKAGAQWQKEQIVLNDNNKEYHRVPSTTLKRLYMNETKYELLKSDIIEGIVGDFEKGTIHNYLTIKIPMLLCPSNCAKGDKVKLIIIKEE